MLISNGRSTNQALIEEAVQAIERVLSEISEYFNKCESEIEDKIKKDAKEASDGDVEIERGIYMSSSFVLDDYVYVYGCFYEALVLASYSFYERMLKRIVLSNEIELVKEKGNAKKYFYADTSVASIERFVSLNPKVKQMIEDMKLYKEKRNDIAHEECTGSDKIEPIYIQTHLNKIKDILLEINSSIEKKCS